MNNNVLAQSLMHPAAVHLSVNDGEIMHKVFEPHVGTSLSCVGTRTTRIRIEPDEDPNVVYYGPSAYLAFDALLTATTGAYLNDFAAGCWQQFKVKVNGREIENRQEVGTHQVRATRAVASQSYRDSLGKVCRLMEDTEANNQGLTTVRLCVPVPSESFLSKIYRTQGLRVEVEYTLNSDPDAISTASGGTSTIAINNIEFHVDMVRSPWLARASNRVNYVDVDWHQATISDAATSASLQIPISGSSLRSIAAVFFDTDDLGNQNIYTKQTHSLFNGTTTYAYKIAGVQYPPLGVTATNGAEVLLNHLRVYRDDFDALHDFTHGALMDGSYDNNTLSSGVEWCWDFRSDPKYHSGKDVLNGSASNTAIFQWAGLANQPTTVYFYVMNNRVFELPYPKEWAEEGKSIPASRTA